MNEVKKTAGQVILEHDKKRFDLEDSVTEYTRAIYPMIYKNMWNEIEAKKNQFPYTNKDFYVCYTFIRDRILRHPKPIIWVRQSCPTPVYDQTVYKYHHNAGTLEFLWVIPNKMLYWHIVHNKQKYIENKETASLAKMVLLMESGELLTWVKKENGNKKDAVIKIKKEEEAQC